MSEAAGDVPPGIVDALSRYFAAVNAGDYATAYAELSPHERATMTQARFATDEASTDDQNVDITRAGAAGSNSETVNVIFTSQQSADKGPGGTTCDTWNLDYTLIHAKGAWLIDSATPVHGSGYTPC